MGNENSKQKSLTQTDGQSSSSQTTSSVKFFLIWFGIPLVFLAFIAWKMSQS